MNLLNVSSIYMMAQVKRPSCIAFIKNVKALEKHAGSMMKMDVVDGIMDELRQAENKLVSFAKEAVASEQYCKSNQGIIGTGVGY